MAQRIRLLLDSQASSGAVWFGREREIVIIAKELELYANPNGARSFLWTLFAVCFFCCS